MTRDDGAEVGDAASVGGGLETDPLVKLLDFIVRVAKAHTEWIQSELDWMNTVANLTG